MRTEDSTRGWPWRIHGDGKTIRPGEIVLPEERMTWPRTIGIGAQHVVAMFGATFLVPLLTGFPPSTTLFFTAIGTLLFLLITKGMMPSYLGSSFGLLAPIGAVTGFAATSGEKLESNAMALAQGGIISVGVTLALVGLVVHFAGVRWIEVTMPPVVTGSIVALIGLNLAPAAWGWVQEAPLTAVITIAAIIVSSVLFRGMLGRLSILIGVLVGYGAALIQGEVDFSTVATASWVGLPTFHAPAFDLGYLGLFLPVVLVLVAENIGHVKSVAAMTGRDLDGLTGRALFADGLATTIAGAAAVRARRRMPRTSASWRRRRSTPQRHTSARRSSLSSSACCRSSGRSSRRSRRESSVGLRPCSTG